MQYRGPSCRTEHEEHQHSILALVSGTTGPSWVRRSELGNVKRTKTVTQISPGTSTLVELRCCSGLTRLQNAPIESGRWRYAVLSARLRLLGCDFDPHRSHQSSTLQALSNLARGAG